MTEWMNGPLVSFVADGLSEVIQEELLPNEFVNRLHSQFQQRRLHWTRLWSLVVLGHFLRRNRSVRRPDEDPALHSFA